MNVKATWADGYTVDAKVYRWLLWWFTDSFVLGKFILTQQKDITLSHLRHELQHVRQYQEDGWWWVWTHPTQREREAKAAETAEWPKIEW